MVETADFYRKLYPLLPLAVRQRIKNRKPPGVNKITVPVDSDISLSFDSIEQSKILIRMAWKGLDGYEPETVRLFRRLATKASVIFDVGGYFGLYSLVAAKANLQAEIHAFEPVPQNARLFRHFLRLNSITTVNLHECALSDKEGPLTISFPKKRLSQLPPTGSIVRRVWSASSQEELEHLEIHSTTLDQFVRENHISRIDLMKIDAEGAEHLVLAGGKDAISIFKPDLVMEYIYGNAAIEGVISQLRTLDYKIFILQNGKLQLFEKPDSSLPGHVEVWCTTNPTYL